MTEITPHEITVAEYTSDALVALDPPEILLAVAAYPQAADWEHGERVIVTSSDGDRFPARVEDVMPSTRDYAEAWIVLD
jgi:hypothetical protein